MNTALKTALIIVGVPAYLIAGLYLSVGIGTWTHNPNNTAFTALALLAAGVVVLVKVAGRRRSGARA
jgi:hypothetical protein